MQFSRLSGVCIMSFAHRHHFVWVLVAAEKGSLHEISTISEKPHVTDIDSDKKDPLLCSLYAPDIYSNLRVTEVCAMNSVC